MHLTKYFPPRVLSKKFSGDYWTATQLAFTSSNFTHSSGVYIIDFEQVNVTRVYTQLAFTCPKTTTKSPEQCAESVQS